jgi:hypothetical protein
MDPSSNVGFGYDRLAYDHIFRESYAQCKSACLCRFRHSISSGAQFFRIAPICRRIAFQRLICRISSSGIRRPL